MRSHGRRSRRGHRRGRAARDARPVRDRRRDRRDPRAPPRRQSRRRPAARSLEVRGVIADPYGQTELRLGERRHRVDRHRDAPRARRARRPAPSARRTRAGSARVTGTIDGVARRKSTSGDIAFSIKGTRRRVRCGSSPTRRPASTPALLRKGAGVTLTGIVGQRASRKGALDGYRLWLRDRADVVITTHARAHARRRRRAAARRATPKPSAGIPKPAAIVRPQRPAARGPAGDRRGHR